MDPDAGQWSTSQIMVEAELQISLCLLDSEEGAEIQQETRGDLA